MNNLYKFRGYILGLLAILLLAMPGVGFPSKQTLDQSTGFFYYFMLWAPFVLAETLFLLSVLLRIQARRSIGEHTRGSEHAADRLVTWGVYSKIRHPLYLSNTGVGISFALIHLGFAWETALISAVLVVYEFVLSRMEDSFLENRFRDEWRAWKSVTPAFIPWIAPKHECQPGPARSFVEAFKSDKSTWIWLCVFFALILLRKFL